MQWVAEGRGEGSDPALRGRLEWLDELARRLPGSPGWLFHLVLAVVGALWLLGASVPGGVGLLLFTYSVLFFLAAALFWGACLLRWVIARGRHKGTRPGWRFLVAPVGGTVFLSALMLDVPLQTRWSLAQPGFDRIAKTAPRAPDPDEPVAFKVPAAVGTYRLERALRVGDDIFVYVRSGLRDGVVSGDGFLLGSGFAYLATGEMPSPNPVDEGGFERVLYRHVGENWYAWSAHW